MSTVAVVGGGLAGLTCAKRLVDAGVRVHVYEGLPYLGGRAATWRDNDGDWIEQGLHLYLGVYTELSALLDDIGSPTSENLRFMSDVKLQAVDDAEGVIATNPLRAPFATAARLLADHRALGPLEKMHAALVAAPAIQTLSTLEATHDHETVHAWWTRVSGNERLLERFIRPFCRGIQFTEVEDFSAFNFLSWFHHLMRHPTQALFGAYLKPREEMMFQALARAITEGGGALHTSTKLARIVLERARGPVRAVKNLVLDDGARVEADAYVLALPFWELTPLLPSALRMIPFFDAITKLPIAPAISVQLFIEGKVIPDERFTLVGGTPACVYQDISTNHFVDERGSRVSVIVSPADDLLDVDDDRIVRMVLDDLSRASPAFKGAQIRKSVVLKHRAHLLRPLPGAMSARPSQATPVPNLFLSGDWTRQPFHGSQEGAVRAGGLTADEVLRALPLQTKDAPSRARPSSQ